MTSPSTWLERAALLTVLAVAVVSARPADACSLDGNPTSIAKSAPDVFQWFDKATAVAAMNVTAAPGFTIEGHGLAGAVEMTSVRVLKGTPPKQHTVQQEMTPCGGRAKKEKLVLFFDDKQRLIGIGDAVTVAALIRWRDTRSPKRDDLLRKLLRDKQPLVAGAATKELAFRASMQTTP